MYEHGTRDMSSARGQPRGAARRRVPRRRRTTQRPEGASRSEGRSGASSPRLQSAQHAKPRPLEVAMNIYPWVILLHIIGAFMFTASHGVAIWMTMVLSRERDRTRMAAL